MGCAAAAVAVVGAVADAIATVTIADVAIAAAIGAAIGGVTDAIEHKPVLPGILEGGITGAVGGVGGAVGGALGGTVGGIAGDILGGAAGGALGGAVTGQGAGAGAESGAIGGAVSGLAGAALSPGGTAAGSPTAGGPGASAAGLAAPASIGADTTGLPLGVNPDTGAPVFSPSNVAAATTGPGFGAAPDAGATFGTAPVTPVAATDLAAPGAAGATAGAPLFAGIENTNATPGIGPQLGANPDTGAPVYAPTGGTSGATADFNPSFGSVTTQDPSTYPIPPIPPSADATGVAAGTLGNAAGATTLATPNVGPLTAGINPNTGAPISVPSGPTSIGQDIYTGFSNASNAVTGGSTGGGSSGGTGVFSNLASGNIPGAIGAAGSAISNNQALALGGALIGYDVLKGNQVPKGENAINAEATQLGAQATQLQSYLASGTLPPGVATALKQAASSSEAAIRSQYAARRESGSSAEAADLANVQNTIVSQGANIAISLLQQGVNEAGLASQLYGQIMNYSLQSDAQLSGALATLAAASARPTTVTLAGTSS